MLRVRDILNKFLAGCGLALALLVPLDNASARGDRVLYSFSLASGGPGSGVISDKKGNLYGTTNSGGTYSYGTVYKLAPDGTETIIYSFQGFDDGEYPSGGLLQDKAGDLYGTTYAGGSNSCGIVFKIAPDGKETILYTFLFEGDGCSPYGSLIADKSGNLYGTTNRGGPAYSGTVFKVSPDGTETVLYNFCSQANCADGAYPQSGLIADTSGNLYGTTTGGGALSAGGTVFRLAPDGTETVLYNFCSQTDCADGAYPVASLISDASGNLYGTTARGGIIGCDDDFGCGTVFQLSPNGSEKMLYTFCKKTNCADGQYPMSGLVADSLGNLYGTAPFGGSQLFGVAFEVSSSGREKTLHNFKGGSDGALPNASLTQDKRGTLYGTTVQGGINSCGYSDGQGCGTIFRIKE